MCLKAHTAEVAVCDIILDTNILTIDEAGGIYHSYAYIKNDTVDYKSDLKLLIALTYNAREQNKENYVETSEQKTYETNKRHKFL